MSIVFAFKRPLGNYVLLKSDRPLPTPESTFVANLDGMAGNDRNKPSPPRRRGPLSAYAAAQEKADGGPRLRGGDDYW